MKKYIIFIIIIFIFCIYRINCDYELCIDILDYYLNLHCMLTYYSHFDSNLLKYGRKVLVASSNNYMVGGNYTAALLYDFYHN